MTIGDVTPTTALVDALAAYRLVRLAQRDRLPPLPRWRARLAAAADRSASPLGELLDCAWCAGVHAAALVVAARRVAPQAWDPVALVLAGSAVVGLLATAEDAADRDDEPELVDYDPLRHDVDAVAALSVER